MRLAKPFNIEPMLTSVSVMVMRFDDLLSGCRRLEFTNCALADNQFPCCYSVSHSTSGFDLQRIIRRPVVRMVYAPLSIPGQFLFSMFPVVLAIISARPIRIIFSVSSGILPHLRKSSLSRSSRRFFDFLGILFSVLHSRFCSTWLASRIKTIFSALVTPEGAIAAARYAQLCATLFLVAGHRLPPSKVDGWGLEFQLRPNPATLTQRA